MVPSLRQFLLVSIVGITAILAALMYSHVELSREYLKDQLSSHNRNLAMLLRNALLADGLEDVLSQRPESLSQPMRDEITQSLAEELRWLPVFKVKVYGPDATTLYSTRPEEIGRDASNNPGVESALGGVPMSNLVRRDQKNELDGSVETIDLHQQYVPIRESGTDNVLGVFEIYVDVSRMIENVQNKQQTVFWSIAGLSAIAYLVFTLMFLRTHRSLQREKHQRETYLKELETTRAELEERVASRTEELDRSRNFLQSVIDGIGNPLLVIQPDYSIRLMNAAARRLLPAGSDSADFRRCYQISHRRDRPCDGVDHPCSFQQVMQHGRAARVRHTHFDADDQPLIVDLVTTPLYSDTGEFEGVIEVEHDVTQMVRMQAGLVESEARLQAIMDNVPDAILTCDAQCIVQSANPAALRMFGARERDLIGQDLKRIVGTEPVTRVSRPVVTTQAEKSVSRIDGSEFPGEIWVGPLDHSGETRYIAVVRDITARRQAQEELEKTRQQYFHQEKMAAIGHLAAGILHEVGNPIAAIAGAASELKSVGSCHAPAVAECPYDEMLARNIDLIDQQTNRLARITREIADFASPRPRERELLDLNSVLRSTARLLTYDRRFRDVELELDLDKELPAVFGVVDQLTQVFMNLMINGLDACAGLSERKPHILLKTCIDGDRVHVTVSDNGCGMSDETLSRAMEPFYTTKVVGKGTGLGLSLSDSIALAHGGFIHIDSEEGEGTTVHFFLPLGDWIEDVGDQSEGERR